MPIAVPYVRFSSDRQQHGSSVHRQEELIVGWLARNPEYTRFERKFEDLGVSGSSGKHIAQGALGKLLAAIADGFIPAGSVVLVEAMDRFSRLEPMDTLIHLQTIVTAGVDLVTLGDGQRYGASSLKGGSLLYLATKAQTAYEYSSRMGDMVTGAYNKKVHLARDNKPIKRRNPFWLTNEGKLRDAPAKALEQVFIAFANGVPLRALAINHKEYFANRQSLKHALRNPAAIGHWQLTETSEVDGKTRRMPSELIKNVFAPAVTEELFYQVQKLLNDLAEQAPTVARKFPMAGLLECGSCGANMVLLRQSSKGATDTVRCYRRMQNNDNCANQRTIPVPVALWFYHETRSPHAFRAYQRTKLPENQRLRIKLEGQIDHLKQQQARLRRLLQMDDDADAESDYQKLVSEKKLLEADLAAVPTLSNGTVVSGFAFHRFMHSDAFAISNLLQLDGYRIICHQDGKLEVNRSADDNPAGQINYVGYSRKDKRWQVAYPNGDTMLVG